MPIREKMINNCPVCNIDLKFFDPVPLKNHLQQHVDDANNYIFKYIHEHFSYVPKELIELWLDRNEIIKKVLPYLNELVK